MKHSHPTIPNHVIIANNGPKHQQGAVLIMSLMILLVMTLIGLASMNSSLMQEKMASNAQINNSTFQAAESAIRSVITTTLAGDQAQISEAITRHESALSPVESTYSLSDPLVNALVQVEYLGVVTTTVGNSSDADESGTTLETHRFEVRGIGNMISTNSQTIIRQGIEYH